MGRTAKKSRPLPGMPAAFRAIAERAPSLYRLWDECLAHRHLRRPEKRDFWYGHRGYPGIKPRFVPIIGICRKPKDDLSTREAYDAVYDSLCVALGLN